RKLVRLSNGWLISSVKDTTTRTGNGDTIRFYKSIDGITWSQLCFYQAGWGNGQVYDWSIVNYGTRVFMISSTAYSNNTEFFNTFDAATVANADIASNRVGLDVAVQALGNCSLAINDTGTELHATWASKNSTYPNSFNLRYVKGTINADGSVTWGTVEQVTKNGGASFDTKNPSIILDDTGIPTIFAETNGITYNDNNTVSSGGTYSIVTLKRNDSLPFNSSTNINSPWTAKSVYSTSFQTQSSPSAIFVPKSINGLANGRIWVAWHGTESGQVEAIRVAYSDDGGLTWSTMKKLTDGTYQQLYPSITASKNNTISIVWWGLNGNTNNGYYYSIKKITNANGVWSSPFTIKEGSSSTSHLRNPSTLFDLTMNITEPLFIYKQDTAKVGFYGTWTTANISVPVGSIGQKVDKSNILSYAITTDGTMSTVIEKLNGVVVGTKTLTSGQNTTINLTQDQWDAIKFGKYKDASAGLHTIEISMGTDKWAYTFDKRLGNDTDILSAVKAMQDTQTTFLTAIKLKLVNAIISKGGSATGSDSFDILISALDKFKNRASGTLTSDSNGVAIVTGLAFKPSRIVLQGNKANYGESSWTPYVIYNVDQKFSRYPYAGVNTTYDYFYFQKSGSSFGGDNLDGVNNYVNSTGFKLKTNVNSETFVWYAYE
ncbi:sialidase family protein, partial [Bacillus sp. S13(2024)]